VPEIVQYEDADAQCPFHRWFFRLEARAAARVTRVLRRLESGLRPDVESVGKGVFEAKIDYGPGYRVYFGLDGVTLVVLLGGGDKRRQSEDIRRAQERWADYKSRKGKGYEHGTHSQLS
jgi:putative addiction module killer protein